MPVYSFKCEKCDQLYDVERAMKDSGKPMKCPKCKVNMQRQWGCGGIVFKGEGWDGQDIKRKREDKAIGRKVKRARQLHQDKVVPNDEILRLNDRVLKDD